MNRSALLFGFIGVLAGVAIGHFMTREFWNVPKIASLELPSSVESPTRAFAKELVVRIVPFDEGVSIEDAVDYLRGQARTGIEIDGKPKPYCLNFVIVDPNHTAKEIRLSLRDIRLDLLCERVAQVSGLTVSFDEDAIVFAATSKQGGQADRGDGDKPPN
jgi:hypothetical protein